MCGVVGVVDRGIDDLEPLTVAMRDRLVHRGPDSAGVRVWRDHGVGLGHRRLAISDRSSAGINPMSNEDGTVWIVFNGEIGNGQALRTELERLGHVFRSRTDTEAVVHAYEEWGDAHVHHLRGMFAYALYDRRPAASRGPDGASAYRVLLVRDRLGVKPLFYSINDRRCVFGSEIKAILVHPGVDRAVDRSAVFDYFTYSCVPAPKTAYAHIRKLPPGHMLAIDERGSALHQYWDVACGQAADTARGADLVARVRAAIAEAVELYMVGDVPVGALLSGGVDSSLVTALMGGEGRRVPTFSMGVGIPGRDETEYAALVAERYGTEHHEVRIDGDVLPGLPERIVEMYDEPFADGSAVPTWQVAAAARQRVAVALSGDGGDEVFGGYNRYWGWLRTYGPAVTARTWRTSLRPWMRQRVSDGTRADPLVGYAQLMELFSPDEKRAWLSPDWAREFDGYDDYWSYRQYWRPELEPATRLQYLDLKTYLPDDILTKVDRASMAVSLEVRPPLLDHPLVELLLSLPADVRTPNAQGKFLLKQAAHGLVPEAILRRPKQGFSAPWTTWIQANQSWAARSLEPSGASTGLFRANLAGRPALPRYGEKVWAALVAECWMRSRA